MASLPADPALLSAKSGRVKAARRLARRVSRAEQQLFLAEGPQAVREALTVPDCVVEIFAVPATGFAHPEIMRAAQLQAVPWRLVDDAALASLADTVNPQGVVAVCRFLDRPLDEVMAALPSLIAICVEVRDPGNAGTVIRCADAAGAGAVVLTGTSVDPYNGKTVRATVGSLFHLPLVIHAETAELIAALQAGGVTVLAADAAGELDLDAAVDEAMLSRPTAWLFGNEARGLPPDLGVLADHRIRIPIYGKAESLNIGAAAAVCLYASARAQRR